MGNFDLAFKACEFCKGLIVFADELREARIGDYSCAQRRAVQDCYN